MSNRGKIVKLNYSELKDFDIVLTGGRSLFAGLIRLFTIGKASNLDGVTHAGLVVDFEGQKLIAELKPDGLELNSLESYNKGGRGPFIVDVLRVPEVEADFSATKQAKQQIATDLRRGIEYDWAGDVAFVLKRVKQSKEKFFCSEYASFILRKFFGVKIRGQGTGEDSAVSPADIARYSVGKFNPVKWFF